MRRRTTSRLALITAMAIGLVAAGAAQAAAHVTVTGTDDVRGGSDAIITFRVPTESDTASTVEVKIQFPIDTPLASVLAQPIAGWSSTETSAKLATPIKTDDGDITEAVSEIDWKANSPATGFKPGEFGEFNVIAGQLPDTGSLTFKAIQTYSDKSVVRWIDVQAPGSTADLQHPAPVLSLGAAAPSATAGTGSAASQIASASGIFYGGPRSVDPASKNSVTIAIVIAAVGVVLGIGGLAVGISARRGAPKGTDDLA